MSSDSEPTENANVTLTKAWVIKFSGMKKPWLPDVMEHCHRPFIRLAKFDRNLTYFVLGKGMDLRKGKGESCNTKSFDHMLDLRRDASVRAVEDVLDSSMGETETHTVHRKKAKKRIVKENDKDMLATPWVNITLPRIEQNGQCWGPIVVKCLWSIKDPDIWVEFQSATLEYIKAMIQSSRDEGKTGRTKKGARKGKGSPKKSPKKKHPPSVVG